MGNSILIIDDNRTIRQQICATLQGTDLFETYHEAGDGIEGFKTLLSEQIDIILCDLEMPGMDGYKFLRMVASREELMDIPYNFELLHGLIGMKLATFNEMVRGLDEFRKKFDLIPFPCENLGLMFHHTSANYNGGQ